MRKGQGDRTCGQGIESRVRMMIPILFFLSGACGLVYEVVWARMLTVIFGTTLFAVSTVLSAYMAGLALGSFAFGRWIDRLEHPLRVFAILEVGIGLFAVLFPWMTSGLSRVYGELYLIQGSFYVFPFVRFALCFLLLSLPTALMGATLPVVTKVAVRRLSRIGRVVGWLYALNTFGAVIGVLVATFILMEWLGLKGSTYAAAGVNCLIGGLAWLFGKNLVVGEEEEGKGVEVVEPVRQQIPDRLLNIVLFGFALSGFAALGYEVAWLRLLTIAFSVNSHYEFSLILTAFLVGLALGSFLCSRFLEARRDLLSLFGGTQILIGLLGASSLLVFVVLAGMVGIVKGANSWWGFRGGIFAVAFGLMLIPTLLMGAAFPLVSRLYTSRLNHLGRRVGDINAVNSLGAIGGSFATGFILIPVFGTEWSFKVLAALNLLVGLAVISLHPFLKTRWKQIVCATTAVSFALLALVPSGVLRRISQPTAPHLKLVYYAEGVEGVVTVQQSVDGFRKLKLNGGGQVPTDYGSFQLFRLLGHLPLLLHPNPQDVLVIALGGGIALGAAVQHDIRHIECVEIVPEMLEAAREHFSEFNHHILSNLETVAVEIIIDDGRNYLRSRKVTYDVITGDATHPISTDSWVLYTREFYELCKARLTENGIMAQWLPFHGLPVEDYKTILRTFQSVFPHATLWRTNNYTVMVGTAQELKPDLALLEQKLESEKVRQSLEEVDLGNAFALLNCFLMDEETLRNYVGEGLLNTDDHPYLSFVGPRGFKQEGWEVLVDLGRHLHQYPVQVLTFLANIDHSRLPVDAVEAKLQAYFIGKEFVLQADILRMQKKKLAALEAYHRALEVNPEDRAAAYFFELLGEQFTKPYQRRLRANLGDVETPWSLGDIEP